MQVILKFFIGNISVYSPANEKKKMANLVLNYPTCIFSCLWDYPGFQSHSLKEKEYIDNKL